MTQYSHGAGCGCKIAPDLLDRILARLSGGGRHARLIVGHGDGDDAAVYASEGDRVILSTTDFFMPIVDDPRDFGAIAAVNAISDIYAMGGEPVMAVAILGWPIERLSAETAGDVLLGAESACARAGIPMAGGHSIDAPEPFFGLAVTGVAHGSHIKRNSAARSGCELYLTKPLGVGLLMTAQKWGVLRAEDLATVRGLMLTLNDLGPEIAAMEAVSSMTDVTGFGLLGHLLEVCRASGLGADIVYDDVPRLPCLKPYLDARTLPGGTARNFASYGHQVSPMTPEARAVLCDPQTSGGLLVAVDPDGAQGFRKVARDHGLDLKPFGRLFPAEGGVPQIRVR